MALTHRSKLELRDDLLRRRRALSRDEVLERSAAILAHVYEAPAYQSSRCIAAYIPILNEVDLRPLFSHAHRDGKKVCLPRLKESGGLAFARYVEGELVKGPRGVMQPDVHLPEIMLADVDLLFIPGLGFDASGNRLGLGAGYYDKTLAGKGATPKTCGVGYDFQWVDSLPADPWDVPLEGLITEQGWQEFGVRNGSRA